MKKRMMTLFLTMALASAFTMGGSSVFASDDSGEEAAASYTVTFYDSDGETVLTTQEVAEGDFAEEYTPEKEGYSFTGWYATPTLSHDFDFESEITADTSVFAGFASYEEDTRSFAIVGSGSSPLMLSSSWGNVINEEHILTKEEVEDANVYTITLDLYEGDEFQFAINSSWEDQRGFGYMETGYLDEVEYFSSSSGLGDSDSKKSNIKCVISGNYTFTLTTYPAEDLYDTESTTYTEETKENYNYSLYDTITWVYNGEVEGEGTESTTDYYIKGAIITGWEDVYTDDLKFTETDGIYTLTITLEEGDEFLFTTLVTSGDTSSVGNIYVRYTNIAEDDEESLALVSGSEGMGSNMIINAAGTYTFTYDPSTEILTVAEAE